MSTRSRRPFKALDWSNGNRTIFVDPPLTGLLVGQTLHTTAAEVDRALIEATAFGALTIIRRVEEYDVGIDRGINGDTKLPDVKRTVSRGKHSHT